jgi:competence protein ComEC
VVLFLVMNFAPVCKRSYDPLSALSLAGILFLLDSPLLLFQSSFQLSFGAMLGVLLLEPTMASFLSRLPLLRKAPSGLPKSFSFSLSIQLALFPLTLYHFYRYPLYTLWANLLVLPTASFLLLFAIAGLFLSYFSLAVGAWVSLPCRVLLWMYEKLCQSVSLLPGASSLLGRPRLIRILLYYLICLGLIFLPKKISSVSSKKGTLISCLLFGSLLPVLLLPLPHNELKITVVDVGQGDCTLICPPSGTTILIDGGSSDLSQVAQDRLIPFLESQGIGELDYVFLSHTDADHVNALEGWLEDGHLIGTIILPELNQTLSQEPSYQGILQLADTYQIPLLTFHAGDSWQEQELSLLCLGPQSADSKEGSSYGSLNAASMVLYLEYEGIRILFPGDCDEEGETFLLQELKERNLSCDILKAAHHGSRTATSTELLQQLQPSLCLISCGVQNTYGHPSLEMLARLEEKGIPYYVTARQGALFLTIRHGKVRFQTMLPS